MFQALSLTAFAFQVGGQLFSALGGLVWAAVIGVAGYLVGSNLALLEAIIRAIGVGGLVFLVVIVSALLLAQERATRRR